MIGTEPVKELSDSGFVISQIVRSSTFAPFSISSCFRIDRWQRVTHPRSARFGNHTSYQFCAENSLFGTPRGGRRTVPIRVPHSRPGRAKPDDPHTHMTLFTVQHVRIGNVECHELSVSRADSNVDAPSDLSPPCQPSSPSRSAAHRRPSNRRNSDRCSSATRSRFRSSRPGSARSPSRFRRPTRKRRRSSTRASR